MLYIEKKCSSALSNQLKQAQKSDHWATISETDSKGLRSSFDLVAPKPTLRDSIFAEQHGLCAYCMRLLPKGKSFTLEHRKPLSRYKSTGLDYQNLFGVCDGGAESSHKEKMTICCDASKGDQEISFDPCNKNHVDQLSYTKDGFIKAVDNPVFTHELTYVLCLNGKFTVDGTFKGDTYTHLVANRKAVYAVCKEKFENLSKKNKLSSATMQRIMRELLSKAVYDEYVGVMLYFYQKKYEQLCKQENISKK
ncbi:MAG: hypothetical protein R3Y07_01120 [Eubacteriales bacterium]